MKYQFLTVLLSCFALANAQQHDSIMNQKISEVVITTTQPKKSFSSKMPLNYLETPQSYDVINHNTIKDQISTNLKDVLQNATGLVRLWESTGMGVTGGEYYTMRGFAFQPNLLNGMPSYNNGAVDITNVEQVEVIKGPNGTLYGGSVVSYGGLINVITKKPYDTFGGDINYTGGSNNLNRIALDLNTPIAKNLFFRLNTSYHKQHSFRDTGFTESIFVAPSLRYTINDKVSLFFDFQYKSAEGANSPMLFLSRTTPIGFHSIDIFKENYFKSYSNNDLTTKNPTLSTQVKLEYKITDNWISNTIITQNNTRSKGYDQFLDDLANGDEFQRYISNLDDKTDILSIQNNLTGKFKLGSFDNTLLVGLDYLSKEFNSSNNDYIEYGIVSLKNQTDTADLTKPAVDHALANIERYPNKAKTETFSSYISNVTNFLPNLSLMASIRVDHLRGSTSSVDNQKTNQTTFSPKFGLVYQPIQNKLALFTNYLNGFVFLDPAIISDSDGTNKTIKPFDPEQANQFEIGAKANLLNGKLTASLSYYHIKVTNKLMTDLNTMNGFNQGGKVKSEGIEITLSGSPLQGWDITTGFSHNYNKVTKSTPEEGNLGTRPEEAGPANTFNFWTNYTIQSGLLKNLSLGVGIYSLGQNKIMNRTTIGAFATPAYTLCNTVISYDIHKFTTSLKIDNIANKKYFTGNSTVNPQGVRTVSVSLNYKL